MCQTNNVKCLEKIVKMTNKQKIQNDNDVFNSIREPRSERVAIFWENFRKLLTKNITKLENSSKRYGFLKIGLYWFRTYGLIFYSHSFTDP